MNAERLIELYERIADVPDAITRLRRFILDLAVRGKLVPQDASDDFAGDLLERAKNSLAKVTGRRASSDASLRAVADDDLPFQIPATWCATRLGQIAQCLDYMRRPINATERGQRIAGKSLADLFPYYGATQQQGWIDEYLFDEEIVLLGEDGVPFFDRLRDKAYLISGKSWVNNHAHVFRGLHVSNQYLVHYLNVFDYSGRVVGATRSKLNQARAVDIPIMLPPLAEQHRIVAKVDELMALCDRLEAAQAQREATRDRLTASTLARLNIPQPPASPHVDASKESSFHSDARFALKVLPALTTRPDQIKQFRQTILNLAVQGRLVSQSSLEEPAQVMLSRIKAHRGKPPTGQSPKISSLATALEAEGVFPLPPGWQWANLGDLGKTQTGSTPPKAQPDFFGSYVPFIRPGDLYDSSVQYEGEGLTKAGVEESGRLAPCGSLLMVCIGTIGKCQVIDRPCSFNQQINALTPYGETSPHYLLIAFRSDYFQQLAWAASARTTIAILNKGNWDKLPVPVPPLAEQRRLVAKVYELIAICDQLEASLTRGENTRSHLLNALLQEALAPAESVLESA